MNLNVKFVQNLESMNTMVEKVNTLNSIQIECYDWYHVLIQKSVISV